MNSDRYDAMDSLLNAATHSTMLDRNKSIEFKPKEPVPAVSVVEDVEVLNDRVVIMRFSDGSFTKAVCTKEDAEAGKFDIDIGITICAVKYMLGVANGNKKAYEHFIKDVHRLMDRKEKAKKEQAEKDRIRKERIRRKAERMKQREADAIRLHEEHISRAIISALEKTKVSGGDDLK